MENYRRLNSLNLYISSLFSNVNAVLNKLVDYQTVSFKDCLDCEEYNTSIRELEYYNSQTYKSLIILFNLLGLNDTIRSLESDFKEFVNKLDDYGFDPNFDDMISKPSNCLWNYYVPLSKLFADNATVERAIVERVLKGVAKYFLQVDFEPRKETDITHKLLEILHLAFPTTQTIAIPHTFKTFKPDIGIADLKVGIECKFVTTKEEAKTAICGVFEDIKGYSGSLDWTYFYSLIYQTKSFLTETELLHEFETINNWKPILVTGLGKRK
ncbi:MAG: hypothetical protein Q8J62_09665 [Candidatus Cloacimonadaceae bacterium]|nr:hypothetical protein [Candidatus Cloacimonadaceae bacterium]